MQSEERREFDKKAGHCGTRAMFLVSTVMKGWLKTSIDGLERERLLCSPRVPSSGYPKAGACGRQ